MVHGLCYRKYEMYHILYRSSCPKAETGGERFSLSYGILILPLWLYGTSSNVCDLK